MIETIYKSETCEGEKPDINIRLPKNIKQIGQGDTNMTTQIYIEENVLSFIKQKPARERQVRYGVLLGDKKQGNGYTYIFINGMVEVEEVIEASIIFSDDVWTRIYDSIRQYYREAMVVGWFASFDYDIAKDMQGIRKLHIDHFAGNHKVFLNINREEDDEAFYIYERNGLIKQPCYHVYFEKSVEFEDYIFGCGRREDMVEAKNEPEKESNKYGIVLNNNQKDDKAKKQLSINKIGRVASFAAIIALTGVLVGMGQNGQLDVLQHKIKGFVDGIINDDQDEINTGNIISVDGSPRENTTSENISEENISEESESEEMSSTQAKAENSSENSELESDSEDESAEEETTTESAHVTISDSGENYVTYVVKSGDTLYSIAMAIYGSADKIQDIMELNHMEDENYVMEGQKIFLP